MSSIAFLIQPPQSLFSFSMNLFCVLCTASRGRIITQIGLTVLWNWAVPAHQYTTQHHSVLGKCPPIAVAGTSYKVAGPEQCRKRIYIYFRKSKGDAIGTGGGADKRLEHIGKKFAFYI
uniref:Uncharacterized protein n=1 Tax=Pyxicephalus adspersus TaxID=30357 RepID=A0AAV3APZ8_PYXAD|nr:TPA: hypothetical protein GDO54_011522 [Pyxicephalus adspersus]